MVAPELVRSTSDGVTLLGDQRCPGGVTLAFTERTGGVSKGCYSSLNLGDACGDDPDDVYRNRLRALGALGMEGLVDSLVCPKQVHGDRVVVVREGERHLREAQQEARSGADAIVCLAHDVPVLLCSADCVLIVLVTEGAFAVVHSGWRGSVARIAGKALRVLVESAACDVSDVCAYIGPHIGACDYEVSDDLAARFAHEFGQEVIGGQDGRHLDLGAAVRSTLLAEGVRASAIAGVCESTASNTDRFFSYRAQDGACGRIGALACLYTQGNQRREVSVHG